MRANGSAALGHMSSTLQLALNLICPEYLVYDALELNTLLPYCESIAHSHRQLSKNYSFHALTSF
jgi:hypothetical protein